ncbi:MAG: riboflavin synthase [Candidatus Marsarchaeota archaeon]|nr:riboflavin synthase [Candidatus Marsarchaeota archaeon]MCL5412785.1 riboflavin synthase [Candidatus Marsarchaeota archaeon]
MKVGFADTTFSRFDYAPAVLGVLSKSRPHVKIERYTVPGIKDLPVACSILFKRGCDIVIACGMVGKMPIDKQCSHEASMGMQAVQLMEGKHILEVFVHVDEAGSDRELSEICRNRASRHAQNALWLLFDQATLRKRAGTGRRQGKADEGPLRKV